MFNLINNIQKNQFEGCDFTQFIRMVNYLQYSIEGYELNTDLQFSSSLDLSCPQDAISKIEFKYQGNNLINIKATTSFLGIIGPTGILPAHYTESIIKAKKEKDTIWLEIINIFYDKIIKLFRDIVQRNSVCLEHEKYLLSHGVYQVKNWSSLVNLTGISTETAKEFKSNFFLNHIGLLLTGSRCAKVLKVILYSYLEVPVTIKEFVHESVKLASEQCSKLGNSNSILGKSLYLGHYADFYQNLITIKIHNLSIKQYNTLLPGLKLRTELENIFDYYLDMQVKYNLVLCLNDAEQATALNLKQPRRLGFNMWLKL
jgi:type VI secretion system protein ImpH